jgi:S-adenosylmethionine decarboxylase proenzyme
MENVMEFHASVGLTPGAAELKCLSEINSIVEVRLNTSLRLGEHYICDFSGCDQELLMDSDRAYALFADAVRKSGLTVLDEGYYKFSPYGFTGFLLLSESHASLHAWPEHGYCAVDLFTCNLTLDLEPLVENLKAALGAESYTLRRLDRSTRVTADAPLSVSDAAAS